MKRSADNSAGPAHNADTRLRKLKTDNSGRPILPVDKKKEKAEDKAKDAVTEILEGLAVTLENDPNGQGRELWNNPGVGHALQHLVKAVEARADKYHVRDDIDVAAERPGLVVTNLSVADVKLRLTVGIVDQLQDPMFDAGPEFFPIFQLHGKRIDIGSALAAHGRRFNTTSLTLLDGSGKLIVARVALTITEKARSLQQGHVIKLTKFHRWHVAPYDDIHSTAGIGLVDFDIVGMGQLLQVDGGPSAAIRSDTDALVAAVCEEADDDPTAAPEADTFGNWDETRERPPIPPACCTAANRSCSMYGTLLFQKCVCEEMLVPTEEDLEDIADKYYATTMPVEAMANNLKRNMLYWYYATEVYHVRGWLDRKPLPTCLVFCIRFIYPNDKGERYVGFIPGHQDEEEEEEENA